jgi:hypothetical protein
MVKPSNNHGDPVPDQAGHKKLSRAGALAGIRFPSTVNAAMLGSERPEELHERPNAAMTGVHEVARRTAAAKAHARSFVLVIAACVFVQLFPVKFALDRNGIEDPLYFKTLLVQPDVMRVEKFPAPLLGAVAPANVFAEEALEAGQNIPRQAFAIAASYLATGPPLL